MFSALGACYIYSPQTLISSLGNNSVRGTATLHRPATLQTPQLFWWEIVQTLYPNACTSVEAALATLLMQKSTAYPWVNTADYYNC